MNGNQRVPAVQAHPSEIQENEILSVIINYVENNRELLYRNTDLKGGWEGWLQVELEGVISHYSSYNAERERPVFKATGQRIDLWCKHGSEFYSEANPNPGEYVQRVGVELKCGGIHQDFISSDEEGNFQNRMISDIEKIGAGMDSDAIGEAGARVFAIGVTTEDADLYGFEGVNATGMQVRYWASSQLPNGVSLYVLWWYQDYQ